MEKIVLGGEGRERSSFLPSPPTRSSRLICLDRNVGGGWGAAPTTITFLTRQSIPVKMVGGVVSDCDIEMLPPTLPCNI